MVRFPCYTKVIRFFRRRLLILIIVFLIIIYILSIIIIVVYENVSIVDAARSILPSFFGEYAELEVGPVGIASLLGLIVYMTFLGVLFGKIAQFFVSITLRGGIIMKKVRYKDHIIICGWNYQGPKIVENLLSGYCKEKPIVILADLEKPPYSSDEIDFLSGVPWKKEDLIRAGIKNAGTAIILTDITDIKIKNPDADALMITLAIESINPKVHTCVQIISVENKIHLENAHADEIICLNQIGGNLLVSSALNHGISKIINEIMNFDEGSEIYRFKKKLPQMYIGQSFEKVAKKLLDKKIILIAFETEKDGYLEEKCTNDWIHSTTNGKVMVINPQGDYNLRGNDSIFIISQEEPTNL